MNIFGDIWNGIVAGLNWLLQAFYDLTGNYGVAIILLTVLVKLILLPLTIKQTRSMIAMQKIQPEIKKLQEKYKDDKEKLSQEMMKFYKENKVNPLGGCLPLILQLPIFFALFTVLRKYLLTPPALIVGNTYAAFKGIPGYIGIAPLPGKHAHQQDGDLPGRKPCRLGEDGQPGGGNNPSRAPRAYHLVLTETSDDRSQAEEHDDNNAADHGVYRLEPSRGGGPVLAYHQCPADSTAVRLGVLR